MVLVLVLVLLLVLVLVLVLVLLLVLVLVPDWVELEFGLGQAGSCPQMTPAAETETPDPLAGTRTLQSNAGHCVTPAGA